MKDLTRKVGRNILTTLLLGLLLFSQGCALLWLGAAGTGGYLIRKGEEGGGGKTQSSETEKKSSGKQY